VWELLSKHVIDRNIEGRMEVTLRRGRRRKHILNVLKKKTLILEFLIFFIQPLKMDLTEGSETSSKRNLTPGKYPKENIQIDTGNLKSKQ
jgi:hypothetical protein